MPTRTNIHYGNVKNAQIASKRHFFQAQYFRILFAQNWGHLNLPGLFRPDIGPVGIPYKLECHIPLQSGRWGTCDTGAIQSRSQSDPVGRDSTWSLLARRDRVRPHQNGKNGDIVVSAHFLPLDMFCSLTTIIRRHSPTIPV